MSRALRVTPLLTLGVFFAINSTSVLAQEVVEDDDIVEEDVIEEDVVEEDVVEEDVVEEDVVEEDVVEVPVEESAVDEVVVDDETANDEALAEGLWEPGEEPYRPPPAGMGVVWGRLVDINSGEPALEAEVKAKDKGVQTLTDYDGYYRLELPPGAYTLEIYYELYEPSTLSNVLVTQGVASRVDQKLTPQQGAIEEEIIEDAAETQTVEGLALARQRSVSQGDAIGREEISKGTDSNAAQAAQRVVGANIVGGRFVYVRGLGERYSNSLLSGFPLPSPEPDKAAVPLDVFPASVLDSLTIVKTFTPDIPGDFAGGSVQIETRSVPSEPLFSVSLTGGINTQATFQKSLSYPGSPTDWLGFDNGSRNLPSSVPRNEYVTTGPNSNLTDSDITNIAKDVNGRMHPGLKTTPMNHGMSVVGGNSWRFKNDSQLGVLGSFNYSRKYEKIEDAITREFRPDSADPRGYQELTDFKYDTGAELIRWGAFGKVSYRVSNEHKISLSALHSQLADDYTRLYTGTRSDTTLTYSATQLDWIQRGMSFGMLSGEHMLKALNSAEFDWDLALANATRKEPNRRDTVYVFGDYFTYEDGSFGPGWGYQNSDESGRHFYQEQKENSYGGKIDWRQPLLKDPDLVDSAKLAFKGGGLVNIKQRDFGVRRLRMQPEGGPQPYGDPRHCLGQTYVLDCPEPLFQDGNIPTYFNVVERPVSGDAYDGGLSVYAGYGMLDWEPSNEIRVAGGVRVEYTDQFVNPLLAIGGPDNSVQGATLKQADVLPSLSFIFSSTKRTKARYSYARTIARPTVREIAPFQFSSYFGGRTETGNPNLQLTTIDNVDARFEFWPTLNEVLAGSVFFKHLQLPIEQLLAPGPDSNVLVVYGNADSANVIGLELEARKSLSTFTPVLNNFTFIGNVTLTYSRVQVPQSGVNTVTNPSRSLMNQAPWVLNLALDYSNEKSGTGARISYNIDGPTLYIVGTRGIQDGYRQPRNSLDLSVSQAFLEKWKAQLQFQNIVNDDYLITVGKAKDGEIWQQYRNGATISLSIGYEL